MPLVTYSLEFKTIMPFVMAQLRFRASVLKGWYGRIVPGDITIADIYFMLVNGEFDGQIVVTLSHWIVPDSDSMGDSTDCGPL
jgi:hypothetical protein